MEIVYMLLDIIESLFYITAGVFLSILGIPFHFRW
jgi:hypothetical protein